jgi:hypothetical protein
LQRAYSSALPWRKLLHREVFTPALSSLDDGSGHTTTIQGSATPGTYIPPTNPSNNGDVIVAGGGGATSWSAPSGGSVPSGITVVTMNNGNMGGLSSTAEYLPIAVNYYLFTNN